MVFKFSEKRGMNPVDEEDQNASVYIRRQVVSRKLILIMQSPFTGRVGSHTGS